MPYCIAVYDMKAKRCARMLKLMRRYLHRVQNSVFEGTLTDKQVRALQSEARTIMNLREDSLIIYRVRSAAYAEREVMGQDAGDLGTIL